MFSIALIVVSSVASILYAVKAKTRRVPKYGNDMPGYIYTKNGYLTWINDAAADFLAETEKCPAESRGAQAVEEILTSPERTRDLIKQCDMLYSIEVLGIDPAIVTGYKSSAEYYAREDIAGFVHAW